MYYPSHRDVKFIPLPKGQLLVVACDSCGGVGAKTGDALKAFPYDVGRFTVRVALMELLSVGATPLCLTDAICNEMEPTGQEILKGIMLELLAAGYPKLPVSGSTEENFATPMTGLGITVMGVVTRETLRIKAPRKNDIVLCAGLPRVGAALLSEIAVNGDNRLLSYLQVKELLQIPGVRQVIPAGSKGVGFEAEACAKSAGLRFSATEGCPIDLQASAGPACAGVVIIAKEDLPQVITMGQLKIIGQMVEA